jgi:hypothetical protein
MSGLSLGTWGSGYAGAAVPAQAVVSPGAPTISQKGFGIMTAGQTGAIGPRTAGFGTVTLGLAGVAVLLYLWYSLPR